MEDFLALDHERACRLCMKRSGNKSIFEGTETPKLHEKLLICTQIQVLENDGLPNHVCDDCSCKLEISYKFHTDVEQTNIYLWHIKSTTGYDDVIKKEEECEEQEDSKAASPIQCDDEDDDENKILILFKREISSKDDIEEDSHSTALSQRYLACTLCQEQFPSAYLLKKHCRSQHKRRRGRPKKINNENISNNRSAKEDADTELTYSKIEEREDVFASIRHTGRAKRLDNGEKWTHHECSICYKRYRFTSGLLNHKCARRRLTLKKSSHGEFLRTYMCEQCGRAFKQKSVLIQHMNTHRETKQYTCKLCSKSFTRSAHLLMHERIHNNVKPYVCESCGRRFTKSSDLSRHCKVHSELRNYPCTLCKKKFKRSGDVASHMRVHTGHRPYSCGNCEKTYSSHSSLKKHRGSSAGCSSKSSEPNKTEKSPKTAAFEGSKQENFIT